MFCITSLITIININDNSITYVETVSFYNLSDLKYINLSNNPLSSLPELILGGSFKMKLFYIVNVSFIDINILALHDLYVNVIITFDYHLCCISSDENISTAFKPWYISWSDILPKRDINILFIAVSCLVTMLNTISIILHFLTIKSNKSFAIIVISNNFNDLLCGIYLGSVWISDMVFKNEFLVKEKMWRSGSVCVL